MASAGAPQKDKLLVIIPDARTLRQSLNGKGNGLVTLFDFDLFKNLRPPSYGWPPGVGQVIVLEVIRRRYPAAWKTIHEIAATNGAPVEVLPDQEQMLETIHQFCDGEYTVGDAPKSHNTAKITIGTGKVILVLGVNTISLKEVSEIVPGRLRCLDFKAFKLLGDISGDVQVVVFLKICENVPTKQAQIRRRAHSKDLTVIGGADWGVAELRDWLKGGSIVWQSDTGLEIESDPISHVDAEDLPVSGDTADSEPSSIPAAPMRDVPVEPDLAHDPVDLAAENARLKSKLAAAEVLIAKLQVANLRLSQEKRRRTQTAAAA